MKILKDKKLENASIELEIEVEKESIQSKYESAFTKIRSEAAIDGFRKGKVPMDIIKKKFTAKADEIACDDIIRETYLAAVKEKNYNPISYPKIEFDKFSKDENLKYKATFEIYPIINLKDYKGISAEEKQIEITAEDLNFEIDAVRERFAVINKKEDSAAVIEDGDLVKIDVKRTDDLKSDELESRQWGTVTVVCGKNKEEHEFDNYVKGMKAGEEKTVNFSYPKDYSVKDLASKKVTHIIKIKEISERKLPELNDQFAKDAGFESVDQMKTKIKDDLLKYCTDRAKSMAKNQILEKIVEKGSFEIPLSIIEGEKKSVFDRFKAKIGLSSFNGTIADFSKIMGKEGDNFEKKLEEEAMKSIKTSLTLSDVAKTENIKVNPEDFKQEVAKMAERGHTTEAEVMKMVKQNNLYEQIHSEMLFEKVYDFLYTNAKIKQLSPISVKEFFK
ncbi:MAG TPA: trigger factor [Spirochaetota bacterium]|nr:trigger factor [Spirochaetota bacterium]